MDRSPLRDAVDRWLAEGPLSVEELADRAVDAGLVPAGEDDDGSSPPDHIEAVVEHSDEYWTIGLTTPDEAVVSTSTFIDTGMTLTHRVTAEELELEAVFEGPDLSLVLWDSWEGLPLDDGTGLVENDYENRRRPLLSGPPDWIDAVQPGEVISFTRTDRTLTTRIVDADELGDGVAEIEALREAARGWVGDGRGIDEVPIVMDALARDPSLFRRPVHPVGELLAAAGLEHRGNEWGWTDDDWKTGRERYQEVGPGRLFEFDSCCQRAYERVYAAYRDFGQGEPIKGRSLAGSLGHGPVAAAFAHAHRDELDDVAPFALAAAETAQGPDTAPAQTLMALVWLGLNKPNAAIDALDGALHADPDHLAAASLLAELELDRGDLDRALALAIRHGAEPVLAEVIREERARRTAAGSSAGRNDPCPCGSGKKFKRCCIDGLVLPLSVRCPLIDKRLLTFAIDPERREQAMSLVLAAAAPSDDVDTAMAALWDDPFLFDVAIYEGGIGRQYLDQRGALLVEDEAEVLRVALDEPRRLWEVSPTANDKRLLLREVETGDEVVVDRPPDSDAGAGDLLVARVVPVDGQPTVFGASVLVPEHRRTITRVMLKMDATATALAAWWGAVLYGPTQS